jgi:hypothetical protein
MVYRKSLLYIVFAFPTILFAQNNLDRESFSINEGDPPTNQNENHLSITTLSSLSFGAFFPGRNGGTLEINKDGIRSSSGSVILLHSDINTSPAVFEIKCPSYTMINLMVDEQIELVNQSGGRIICVPNKNELSNFVSPNNAETGFLYSLGAKLIVQDASFETPGEYSGRFNVFIVLE